MQYKLPIVTTNEGGIPDVVKDGQNGFVCRRKDANSLADAIKSLLRIKNFVAKWDREDIYDTKKNLH